MSIKYPDCCVHSPKIWNDSNVLQQRWECRGSTFSLAMRARKRSKNSSRINGVAKARNNVSRPVSFGDRWQLNGPNLISDLSKAVTSRYRARFGRNTEP